MWGLPLYKHHFLTAFSKPLYSISWAVRAAIDTRRSSSNCILHQVIALCRNTSQRIPDRPQWALQQPCWPCHHTNCATSPSTWPYSLIGNQTLSSSHNILRTSRLSPLAWPQDSTSSWPIWFLQTDTAYGTCYILPYIFLIALSRDVISCSGQACRVWHRSM